MIIQDHTIARGNTGAVDADEAAEQATVTPYAKKVSTKEWTDHKRSCRKHVHRREDKDRHTRKRQ